MFSNNSNLPKGFSWVAASNGSIPPNAVVAGKEKSGEMLYIARIAEGNEIHVGKCGQHVHGAIVARDGREQFFSCYEVLCGCSPQLKWVEQSGTLDGTKLNGIPFIGGVGTNGAAFYVSRAKFAAPVTGHGGAFSVGLQPGKIGALMKGASVTYNGVECIGNKYEVLVLEITTGPTWMYSENGEVPYGAFEAGHENDARGALYACCAPFKNNGHVTSRQVGKFAKHLGGGSFAYNGREVTLKEVMVLLGNLNQYRWVPFQGRLDVRRLAGSPVMGGFEEDGEYLYMARTEYAGGIQPGKVSVTYGDGMHFGSDNREKTSMTFEVLCYNY